MLSGCSNWGNNGESNSMRPSEPPITESVAPEISIVRDGVRQTLAQIAESDSNQIKIIGSMTGYQWQWPQATYLVAVDTWLKISMCDTSLLAPPEDSIYCSVGDSPQEFLLTSWVSDSTGAYFRFKIHKNQQTNQYEIVNAPVSQQLYYLTIWYNVPDPNNLFTGSLTNWMTKAWPTKIPIRGNSSFYMDFPGHDLDSLGHGLDFMDEFGAQPIDTTTFLVQQIPPGGENALRKGFLDGNGIFQPAQGDSIYIEFHP